MAEGSPKREGAKPRKTSAVHLIVSPIKQLCVVCSRVLDWMIAAILFGPLQHHRSLQPNDPRMDLWTTYRSQMINDVQCLRLSG